MQAILQFTREEYEAWVAAETEQYAQWATERDITGPQYSDTTHDNPLAVYIGSQMNWTPGTEMREGAPVAVFTEYETDTEIVMHLPDWTREIIERIPPRVVVYGPPAVQTEYGVMHDLTAGMKEITPLALPNFPLLEAWKRETE